MANYTRTRLPGGYLYHWLLTTADPVGQALQHVGSPERTIQIIAGTAGGATCVVQGSNDGVNYATLTQGDFDTAHSYTATTACELVAENPRWVRPNLTTGGTDAVWNVYLVVMTPR